MSDKYAILICKEGDHKDERMQVMGPYNSEREAERIARGVEVNMSDDWYVIIDACCGDEDWLPKKD